MVTAAHSTNHHETGLRVYKELTPMKKEQLAMALPRFH
jgi:hypothetical protein